MNVDLKSYLAVIELASKRRIEAIDYIREELFIDNDIFKDEYDEAWAYRRICQSLPVILDYITGGDAISIESLQILAEKLSDAVLLVELTELNA